MYSDNKIESATYINKSDGGYIPFRVRFHGTNCTFIQQMIDEPSQTIEYIDIDNK